MSVSVRAASPGDFPAVARLTVAAYDADGQLAGGNGYERTLANVAARADAGQLLVAVDPSGAIQGAVLFALPGSRYAELARDGEGEFRMLAVDPAAQGRGVGRALVLACLDRAAATGCTAVVISVRDTATTAQRLYTRLGFQRVPQLDWSPLPDVHLLGLRRDVRIPAGHA
jgi:ribosomal protein S18 acetylase RimI-like enzyme